VGYIRGNIVGFISYSYAFCALFRGRFHTILRIGYSLIFKGELMLTKTYGIDIEER
jgi:hypothetical protein